MHFEFIQKFRKLRYVDEEDLMARLLTRTEEKCDAVVVRDTSFVWVDNLPVFVVNLAGDDIAACMWRRVCADRCCARETLEHVSKERHG